MTDGVNVVELPGGQRLTGNYEDASVKADALRLGVLPALNAELSKGTGARGAVVMARDGDARLVAIIGRAGFGSDADNGWTSLSITPATEQTARLLLGFVELLVNVRELRALKGDEPWRN